MSLRASCLSAFRRRFNCSSSFLLLARYLSSLRNSNNLRKYTLITLEPFASSSASQARKQSTLEGTPATPSAKPFDTYVIHFFPIGTATPPSQSGQVHLLVDSCVRQHHSTNTTSTPKVWWHSHTHAASQPLHRNMFAMCNATQIIGIDPKRLFSKLSPL